MQFDPLMTLPAAAGGAQAGKGTAAGPGTGAAPGGDDTSLFARALGLAIEPLRARAGLAALADTTPAPGDGRASSGKASAAPDLAGDGPLFLPDEACSAGPPVDAAEDLAGSARPSPEASENLVVPWLDLGPGLVAMAREFLPVGATTGPAAKGDPTDATAGEASALLPGKATHARSAHAVPGQAGIGLAPGARRADAAGKPDTTAAARPVERRGRAETPAAEDPARRTGAALRSDEPLPPGTTTTAHRHDPAADAVAHPNDRAPKGDSGSEMAPMHDTTHAETPPAVANAAPQSLPDTAPAVAGTAPAIGSSPAAADNPPAEVQLPTPLGTPEFMPHLGAELTVLARDGVQHARVHVNPAEMGPIAVQLTLDGQQAQVSLVADNALTRQLLEQQMPSLAAALRENGLTLTGGGVFEQPRQAREQADGQRQGSGAALRHAGADAGDDATERAAPRVLRRQGVVDLYA